MRFQKMMQHMQKFQNVSLVVALLSLPDIIHDHVSDLLHAVLLLRKVLSEGGRGDFGHQRERSELLQVHRVQRC
jgi:hypothetical protein